MWKTVLLFVLLSPGILLTIPPVGNKVLMSGKTCFAAVVVHAILFAVILRWLNVSEGFQSNTRQVRVQDGIASVGTQVSCASGAHRTPIIGILNGQVLLKTGPRRNAYFPASDCWMKVSNADRARQEAAERAAAAARAQQEAAARAARAQQEAAARAAAEAAARAAAEAAARAAAEAAAREAAVREAEARAAAAREAAAREAAAREAANRAAAAARAPMVIRRRGPSTQAQQEAAARAAAAREEAARYEAAREAAAREEAARAAAEAREEAARAAAAAREEAAREEAVRAGEAALSPQDIQTDARNSGIVDDQGRPLRFRVMTRDSAPPPEIYNPARGGFRKTRLGDDNIISGGGYVSCTGPNRHGVDKGLVTGSASLGFVEGPSLVNPHARIFYLLVEVIEFGANGIIRHDGYSAHLCRISTTEEVRETQRHMNRIWG